MVASGTTKPSSPLAKADNSLRDNISSEFLSYRLKRASTCCSSSFAAARVSRVVLIFTAFSTTAPDSRLMVPVLWRSCANNCLVSSFSALPVSTGLVLGASFMAGWFTRKNSEQSVANFSTSAAASLRAAEVASTACRLRSFCSAKASDFSLNASNPFSASSTSPFSSSMSFSAFSSCSRFFLSSSSFFSSSFLLRSSSFSGEMSHRSIFFSRAASASTSPSDSALPEV
mmetsp:Transcript_91248/g.282255  ORF Transcript_91248/g.282255 Transcript_91248/m.282255 type:complete len:229 (+) Transcript_91248:1763-2449(+)